MNKTFLFTGLFLLVFSFQANGQAYEFVNGNWYDGEKFVARKFYAVDGAFAKKRPAGAVTTIDLKNGYVIPPLADAHTHNLDGKLSIDSTGPEYLNEGTFYVQVLCNYATGAVEGRKLLNKPSTVDVIYANGGLTSTLGHPFLAYEPRALGFWDYKTWDANMDKIKASRIGENNVYWFLDSIVDVDAKWDKFLAQKPDVVKILLLNSDRYEEVRKNDKVGDKGLSPEVAEYVVKKAHAANLRVYAHIENAADFRLGVKIGVDGFAHSPYYGWDGKEETRPKDDLTVADLKTAARKKIVVIPTAQITQIETGADKPENRERFERALDRQRKLFKLMLDNGVRIALGSDYFGRGLRSELEHWYQNKVLGNKTLLQVAVEETPLVIFPNRKIGKLRDGYEASFIVLEKSPLEDFAALKSIRFRFKQGGVLEVPKAKS